MRKPLMTPCCVLVVLPMVLGVAWGKSAPPRTLSNVQSIEMPQAYMNAPEIGGSMFQAAATTVVLATGVWKRLGSEFGIHDFERDGPDLCDHA